MQNLARALAALKERGFLVVGLDSDAAGRSRGDAAAAPLALVLGAEGKGLRQLTRAQTAIGWPGSTCPARSRA